MDASSLSHSILDLTTLYTSISGFDLDLWPSEVSVTWQAEDNSKAHIYDISFWLLLTPSLYLVPFSKKLTSWKYFRVWPWGQNITCFRKPIHDVLSNFYRYNLFNSYTVLVIWLQSLQGSTLTFDPMQVVTCHGGNTFLVIWKHTLDFLYLI